MSMTIVVTGGGSGGHITPLLAVASEIKQRRPDARVVCIAQRGDRFGHVVAEHKAIDEIQFIWAGKFRRYHGEGLRQLLDIKTVLLNIRDMFLAVFGLLESLWRLMRLKPDAVFVKGGFVGVPVGLAAAAWRIPYITHDSDALAGLANRIIARWAAAHAVALPRETYAYPARKTVTTGIPIAGEYEYVTAKKQQVYKKQLGLPAKSKVILLTGGGLGAQILNESIVASAAELLEQFEDLYILHTTGHKHHKEIDQAYKNAINDKNVLKRVRTVDYTNELYTFSGAADVVIARAGATNMAEMAMQGKACVVVPSPVLAGGHQLKNAKAYQEAEAAVVLPEATLTEYPGELGHTIGVLLQDDSRRARLGKNLHAFAHKDSSKELVNVLFSQVKGEQSTTL